MTTRSFGNERLVKQEGSSLAVSLPRKELSKIGVKTGDILQMKVDVRTKTILLKLKASKPSFDREERV